MARRRGPARWRRYGVIADSKAATGKLLAVVKTEQKTSKPIDGHVNLQRLPVQRNIQFQQARFSHRFAQWRRQVDSDAKQVRRRLEMCAFIAHRNVHIVGGFTLGKTNQRLLQPVAHAVHIGAPFGIDQHRLAG